MEPFSSSPFLLTFPSLLLFLLFLLSFLHHSLQYQTLSNLTTNSPLHNLRNGFPHRRFPHGFPDGRQGRSPCHACSSGCCFQAHHHWYVTTRKLFLRLGAIPRITNASNTACHDPLGATTVISNNQSDQLANFFFLPQALPALSRPLSVSRPLPSSRPPPATLSLSAVLTLLRSPTPWSRSPRTWVWVLPPSV